MPRKNYIRFQGKLSNLDRDSNPGLPGILYTFYIYYNVNFLVIVDNEYY